MLFDPGEGTQRQLLLAGVPASRIDDICITHFHGDHCLGLPGVLQRLSLDAVGHPVRLRYPASGQVYVDRLRTAAIFDDRADVVERPVARDGVVADAPPFRIVARALDHRTPCLGWRLEEPGGRRFLPDRLAAAGVAGPDVGRLERDGSLPVDDRVVRLEDVSAPRPGQVFAFVMDTRPCDAALALAQGADLLVCESTFLDADAELAEAYGHLTAGQAARLARDAGARRLVLTHFSQRYPDDSAFLEEAAAVFPDVVVARDLATVAVPARTHRP